MPAKVLSLFHAPCGARLSRVRLGPTTGWQAALTHVGQDLEARRCRCPRCKMPVAVTDLLPSVDDADFVPVQTADESGLVGFGPGQNAKPGARL